MLDPVDDLLVQYIEAHRSQRHPTHNVDGAEPGGGVGRLLPKTWHQVTESDRGQGHETEIDAVQNRPVFQPVKRQSTEQNVDDHHGEAEQDGS